MNTRRGWLLGSALAAVGVYVLMWLGYTRQWAWVARMDAWALEPLYAIGEAHPGWVSAWTVFCAVLGPGVFRVVTLLVIVVALIRRNIRLAVFLVITVELSGLVTEIAKTLVNRSRPDTAMVSALGESFPSGHALGLMVSVPALLIVVLPFVHVTWRAWLVTLGVVVVVAIGAGRVVLNVHHPSDVIAGWALGYAYLVACLLLVPPRPRMQGAITPRDEMPAAPGTAR